MMMKYNSMPLTSWHWMATTCATYRECRSNDVFIIVRSILERTIRSENDLIELLSTDTAAMSALPSRTDVVNVAGHVR